MPAAGSTAVAAWSRNCPQRRPRRRIQLGRGDRVTAEWLDECEELWRLCDERITVVAAHELLSLVANTPAPSGASSLTRGLQVRTWCEKDGLLGEGAQFQLDAYRTGCDLLRWGQGGIRLLAHLDEVSYLVEGASGVTGRWWVAPYCYHLAEVAAPARAVRFTADGAWTVVAWGHVTVHDGRHVFESTDAVELAPGDRVSLASDVKGDVTGRVTGSLDNAAGVTAALLAATVLSRLGVPFSLALTDEEEGPSGAASQTIARGAARLFRHLGDAPLTVAIDIHGVPDREAASVDGHRSSWGASLAEFSSHGRGSVAPPQLYAGVAELLCDLGDRGVVVRQNVGGYVPRSDDVVAMTHGNRVVVLGYPGVNRHFDRGLPAAHLGDLVHLARALVVLAVAVQAGHLAVDW